MSGIDTLVLGTVNAPWRRSIDAPTLLACLRDPRRARGWAEHVRTFFEDVPREAIYRFMLAHRLSARRVRATYRSLVSPEERRHADFDAWLSELAVAA